MITLSTKYKTHGLHTDPSFCRIGHLKGIKQSLIETKSSSISSSRFNAISISKVKLFVLNIGNEIPYNKTILLNHFFYQVIDFVRTKFRHR